MTGINRYAAIGSPCLVPLSRLKYLVDFPLFLLEKCERRKKINNKWVEGTPNPGLLEDFLSVNQFQLYVLDIKQEITNNTVHSFPEHTSKYFLQNIWSSILSMPACFRRIIHQQTQVSSFDTFYSKPESLTIVLLSKYTEWQPSYPWYSPNCCWKMLLLSDLVTAKLPQSRCCPKLPAAYQLSHRAI